MHGYITGFTVYTLAMVGLIFIAYVIAKKSLVINKFKNGKQQFLAVENSLDIAPRKSIHVIRAGEEKFLVATDTDRTSFLTKLKDNSVDLQVTNQVQNTKYTTNRQKEEQETQTMMRGILAKLNT